MSQIAGCKRCALKRRKGRKKRKEKEKGGKNGDDNVFLSTRACFYIYAVVIFGYINKSVSRVSKSYPLLIVYDQNFNGESM